MQEEAEEPLESKDPSDLEDFEDSVEPHEENLEESEEPLVKIQQESTPPEDAPISRRTRRKPSTVSLKLENTLEEKAPAVKEIIEDQVDEIKEQAIESSEEKLELESAWKRLSTESFEEGKEAVISGRVMSLRGQGEIMFADVFDGTEKLQAFCSKEEMSE